MNKQTSYARWILGGAIGLVAVVQSLRSLGALAHRGATLGVIALGSLAVLTVLGMVSLWRARRRIEDELAGLAQRPSRGELVDARRARLAKIAESGGTPDRDALAETSAAGERGQAYLGRYLVAVAVLIGLVGTFSGLAEALRGLPSILGGLANDPQKLASLLSGPLAGLDVTFAAGIVGILSTLALSLVQGDLQLHEELALARLEEETTLELIPALWPRAQSVEERSARELAALRTETREILVAAGATIGTHLAEATARSSETLVKSLTAAVEASTKRVSDELAKAISESLRAQTEAARQLREDGTKQLTLLQKTSDALLEASSKRSASLEQRFVDQAGKSEAAIVAAAHATVALSDELRTRAEESASTIGAQLAALHRELGSQAEATQLALTTEASRAASDANRAWELTRSSLVTVLEATRASLVSSIDETRASLVSSLTETHGSLVSSAEQTRTSLVSSLDETRTSLVSSFDGARTSLVSSLDGVRCAIVDENIAARAALMSHASAAVDVLERTAEAGATQLADAQRAAVDAMTNGVAATTQALTSGVAATTQAVAEAQRTTIDALTRAVDGTMVTLAERAIEIDAGIGKELGATRVALSEAALQASTSLAAALQEGTARLETLLSSSRGDLFQTLAQSRELIDHLVRDSVGALGTSASSLAASAELLSSSTTALSPQIDALVPELRSLTQEVALLGTRTTNEEEPLFADELVRLGEGMERLEAMVRLAQGRGEGAQG